METNISAAYRPVIEVKNLYKIYRIGENKVRALNGVDFSIGRGEFCSVVGASGSGKSTLLNMLAGLERATKGEIIIAGSVQGVGGIVGAAARYGNTDGSKLILVMENNLFTGKIRTNTESELTGNGGIRVGGILGYDYMYMHIYIKSIFGSIKFLS